tara:strand:- start:400 stop:582 length:183 start_codon:yes stop_codon:yes gene_type:complete
LSCLWEENQNDNSIKTIKTKRQKKLTNEKKPIKVKEVDNIPKIRLKMEDLTGDIFNELET